MELTSNAKKVIESRYLRIGEDGKACESPEDMLWRVSTNIAAVDSDYYQKTNEQVEKITEQFYELMDKRLFMPNSPTLMNAGRELQQLAACFVLPIHDSMESIFESIKNAALIHKSGGGTGFPFSSLRPKDDIVNSTGGVASGPISFLKVFNSATEAVKQGGTRRGANMGVLRIDHPDILDFITCKADHEEISNFNISVGLTNEFMEAVHTNRDYNLINPKNGESKTKLNARGVFQKIVDMAWHNGEPGIIFLDQMNSENPTPKLGEIESTNPCGEQPLLPYESCNLGSINLSEMVTSNQTIDYQLLHDSVTTAVHFLDNVIDANKYPLTRIEDMTKGNRKIGLGVMGFGDMLFKLHIPYNSQEALDKAEELMDFINRTSKQASIKLAEERGPFPNFDQSIYSEHGDVPIRNATTTTIAPTGTISLISGSSGGIEPLFALAFTRNVLDNTRLTEINSVFKETAIEEGFYEEELMKKVAEEGSIQDFEEIPDWVKEVFVTSHDISPEWHLKMQAAFQKYTDNAVSKTVNLPKQATQDDIYRIYQMAYELNCKGVTVYRDESRTSQVMTKGQTTQSTEEAITPRKRPSLTTGVTERIKTGCGNLYVTVNEDEEGLCEVFASMGKSGGCAASQSEATARLTSMALRSGLKVNSIIKELRGIRCPSPAWQNGGLVLSCPDAIAIVLDRYITKQETGEEVTDSKNGIDQLDMQMGACPECGGEITQESGCGVCYLCGYSKC